MKKFFILLLTLSMIFCFVACTNPTPDNTPDGTPDNTPVVTPEETKYNDALAKIEAGEYEEAYALLLEIGDYKNAQQMLASFRYVPTTLTHINEEGITSVVFSYGADNLPLHIDVTTPDGNQHTTDCVYDKNCDLVQLFFEDAV